MSGNRFSFGNMDALSDISFNGHKNWKKDNYQKSIISPLPQRSWIDRYFCCFCRDRKVYS